MQFQSKILSLLLLLMLLNIEAVIAYENVNDPWNMSVKSAEDYLQAGHRAKRNGDLLKAIEMYKKSLSVKPKYKAAENSLNKALSDLELINWSKGKLPEECRSGESSKSLKCANEFFAFAGEPINPKIVQDLETWLSDNGDQIVAINLGDSQHSNRYFCKDNIQIDKNTFYCKEKNVRYGYQYIGKTLSGVHILLTSDYAGGTGVFMNLVFVIFAIDEAMLYDKNKSSITLKKERLLIKKLGEISLGDRWSGELKIDRNNLVIGANNSQVTQKNNPGSKERVIRLDFLQQ